MNNPSAIVAGRLSATTRYRVGRWRGRGRQVALACLLLASSDAAMAACSRNFAGIGFDYGDKPLSVTPGLPVGSWIDDWLSANFSMSIWTECGPTSSGWIGAMSRLTTGTVVPGIQPEGYTVYETSLPGVGVAVAWQSSYNGYGVESDLFQGLTSVYGLTNRVMTSGPSSNSVQLYFKFRPVKTGSIVAGTASINTLNVSSAMCEELSSHVPCTLSAPMEVAINFVGGWVVTIPTCIIPNMTVPMGNHRKTS